ncbi:L,D-transpeptidase [Stenoxybacter acetivorans]|uniref:L,D-transpeptidase n=1 Tax=Stenoxybacter acetivorans TaxID=422441 RepID=UPI000690E2BA|nr:L,D-transpeptidase [Stenoxybacter acetivorans]
MVCKKFKTVCLLVYLVMMQTVVWAAVLLPDFAPPERGQQVVINVPQLKLFLYQDGVLLKSYDVAVGTNRTKTPLGEYHIGGKAYKPTWVVPKSIQKEMEAKGQEVLKTVKYGEPRHPLGPVFVRLGDPKLGLGIHGTNAPASVPGVRSHGCVRMKSPNALDFAKSVESGSDASVIYQLAGLNADDAENLWLAAYPDPYFQKNLDKTALINSINDWAQNRGLTVDHKLVALVLKNRSSKLNCITCNGKQSVSGSLKAINWQSGLGTLVQAKPIEETPELLPGFGHEVLPEGDSVEVETEAAAEPVSSFAVPVIREQKSIPVLPIKARPLFPEQ